MTDFIPPAKPIIGDEERAAVDRVLRSGMLAQGPEVKAFEEEFCGALRPRPACVAVNSGTSGQHLGLLASGVGAGRRGHRPVVHLRGHRQLGGAHRRHPGLRRHRRRRLLPLPGGVEAAITERTVGVMPVHLYGHPAKMDRIMAIAERARHPGVRGRRPGARRVAERHPGRGLRHVRDVLAVPDEEHDLGRGRHGLGGRRRGRAPDAALPQPGHGAAVPQRGRGLQHTG